MIEKIQIVHKDVSGSLERMPYESVGRLLMALIAYAKDEDFEEIIKDDPQAYTYFPTLQGHIDRMEEGRVKGAKNGSKGGAPIGNQNARKTSENNLKQPKTTQNKQKQTPNLTYPNLTLPNHNDKTIVEILAYLNEMMGTHYGESKETTRLINGRLGEGFTLDDFKKVIDKKVKEWKGTEQAMYIRPSTLFAPSHFEEYLNAPEKEKPKNSGANATCMFNRYTQRPDSDYDYDKLILN